MGFNKTARPLGRCGKCRHFEKAKNICNHKNMNEMEVWPESVAPCGGELYSPVDDYEKAE